MSKIITRAKAAAAAVMAEGATLTTFAAFARKGVTSEGQAREAAEAAGVAYWQAAREAWALSCSKVSVRDMADASGVAVADVHALTRLGRVAAVVDGTPTGADALAMLQGARSRDGQRVGPFDAVAEAEGVTVDTVAVMLADAMRADAANRAKVAREAEAKRKAAEAEAEAARIAAEGQASGTPEGSESDGQTPEGTPEGQAPEGDAAPTVTPDTLADAWRNLAAWAEVALALIDAGDEIALAEAEAAMVAVSKVARKVSAARKAANAAA